MLRPSGGAVTASRQARPKSFSSWPPGLRAGKKPFRKVSLSFQSKMTKAGDLFCVLCGCKFFLMRRACRAETFFGYIVAHLIPNSRVTSLQQVKVENSDAEAIASR